jgi:hypothetical protein
VLTVLTLTSTLSTSHSGPLDTMEGIAGRLTTTSTKLALC